MIHLLHLRINEINYSESHCHVKHNSIHHRTLIEATSLFLYFQAAYSPLSSSMDIDKYVLNTHLRAQHAFIAQNTTNRSKHSNEVSQRSKNSPPSARSTQCRKIRCRELLTSDPKKLQNEVQFVRCSGDIEIRSQHNLPRLDRVHRWACHAWFARRFPLARHRLVCIHFRFQLHWVRLLRLDFDLFGIIGQTSNSLKCFVMHKCIDRMLCARHSASQISAKIWEYIPGNDGSGKVGLKELI